jgi:transposase
MWLFDGYISRRPLMERDGSGVSALAGIDGFVVTAQLLDEESGEWWLAVETLEDRAWCESCAVRAVGHGRRRVVVRDLPMAGRPMRLVWAKRLWRCPEPTCPARTWSEESDEIAPRAVLTERARAEICRRVGPAQHSVAQAARDFGVSWHAAMAAVGDHGRPRVDHLSRLGAPSAVGLDETSFLAATAEHPTMLVTGIIDLDRGRLVDVLPARSAVAVTDWLDSKPVPWLAGITHVVIDPYQPYATAVATGLPEARLVVDHFHVIRLANAALDEVRRRTQHATTGHRAAARMIRSTGSAAVSWPVTNSSAPTPSLGSSRSSMPATPTAKSAPPTSPRSCCARPTSPPTRSMPAGASPPSTTTAPEATSPS